MSSCNSLRFLLRKLVLGSQPIHRCSTLCALTKNCCSGHQNVSTRGTRQRSSLCIDAAVYFNFTPRLNLRNHLTDTPDLPQGCREEMLMPETRIDRHDQHLFDVLYDFLQHRGWGCRVDGESGTFAQGFDTWHCAVQIGVTFPMNKKRIRPRFDELV